MNKRQKIVIIIGMTLIFLMGIMPPWIYTHNLSVSGLSVHDEKPAGYGFIFRPPSPENTGMGFGLRIDSVRLIFQLGMVIALVFGFLALLKNQEASGRFKVVRDKDSELLDNLYTALCKATEDIQEFEPDKNPQADELLKIFEINAEFIERRDVIKTQIFHGVDAILRNQYYQKEFSDDEKLKMAIMDWMKYYADDVSNSEQKQ